MSAPNQIVPFSDDYYYEALPFVETHPDHLGAIGALFGLYRAPPRPFRLLEIGTATGGNILPMAAAFPDCQFVAVDRAEQSMFVAKNIAERVRLPNIVLHLADIREFADEPESFDFIVCHGVYSWIPNDARLALRKLIQRHLAPTGLAYVSFNTLPGWHLRGSLREMLRREDRQTEPHADRVARAREFLQFLTTNFESTDPARAWLTSEISLLGEMSDDYLLGEHLVAHNQPEYFQDFVDEMARDGLAFVSDAHVPLNFPDRLGPEATKAIHDRGADFLRLQQSLDLLELRCFRRAILCRNDAAFDRRVVASRLEPLAVRSRLEPLEEHPDLAEGVEVGFNGSSGVIATDQALLKAALVESWARSVRGVSFETLAAGVASRLGLSQLTQDARARLCRNLLGLYTKGALTLWSAEKPIAIAPSARPVAFSFAREQAIARSPFCTSLLHEAVRLDSFDRSLLARLDGTRDVSTLAVGVLDDARAGIVSVEQQGRACLEWDVFAEIVEQKLLRFARLGVLVA